MPSTTKFPSTNDASGFDWTNPANADASDNVKATASFTIPLNGAQFVLNHWGTFGFDAVIPVGATIDTVVLLIEHGGSETDPINLGLQVVEDVGGAGFSHPKLSAATGAEVVDTIDVTSDRAWIRDDLLDGTFTVAITVGGTDDLHVCPCIESFSVDSISVQVTYHTGPGAKPTTVALTRQSVKRSNFF